MAELLTSIERESAANPTHSVIWLHGLGADGHDFEPIVPELHHPDLPAIRYVFPHAPIRPVTLNMGMSTRAWYDIFSLDRDAHEDIDGIKASRNDVMGLIVREVDRGIPPENIVLAGFSQGCAMALYTGLRHAFKLAGIVALSGYLPLRNTLAAELHPANANTPIFMAQGEQDMVVSMDYATTSREVLVNLGLPLEWHTYGVGHGLHPDEIDDIRSFLVRVLG